MAGRWYLIILFTYVQEVPTTYAHENSFRIMRKVIHIDNKNISTK